MPPISGNARTRRGNLVCLVGAIIGGAVLVWLVFLFKILVDNDGRKPGGTILSYQATKEHYVAKVGGLTYENVSFSSLGPDEVTWFKLGDLLSNWNPDDTSPAKWVQSVAYPHPGTNARNSIPRFDYSIPAQREAAEQRRVAEVPFIVYNIPALDSAARNAFQYDALLRNMGSRPKYHTVERIPSNKYMYYNAFIPPSGEKSLFLRKNFPEWEPPQQDVHMTFAEFVRQAEKAEWGPDLVDPHRPYYYLTISANKGRKTPWIRNSFPFFEPKRSFFIVDPSGAKGINCRFGMRGVAAANHFDAGRNCVAMVRGRKRYVLLPPEECKSLELYPEKHPATRHTAVDWSNITLLKQHAAMYTARATEVVVSMGEVLYIPSYWFHYIVSQDASIQCNARSGMLSKSLQHTSRSMKECGFK